MADGDAKKRGRGRLRTGTLEFRHGRWQARLTVTVDGEPVRKWFDLGTENKSAAKRKMMRLVSEQRAGDAPSVEAAKAPETVDSYAEAWIAGRKKRGLPSAEYEERFYRRVWSPAIGKKQLDAVTASDISGVLESAANGEVRPAKRKHARTEPGPYGRQSIEHMRATLYRIFDSALRNELVSKNRVEVVPVPEMDEEKKPRAVLTDEEFGALVGHPDVDAEIKLLVLLSRTIGGLRAGDLNSLDWTAFSPGFATCTFVRRKTRKKRPTPETFEVPTGARPFIAAWWERQGQPEAGPVFPVRRGKRAGEAKKRSNMSYADRLRRELLKAGVTRRELHHETATTLPVDFHSTRRAYAQALAAIGLNAQQAAELTGHSDLATHQRYLQNVKVRVVPAAAVPSFDPSVAVLVANRENRPQMGAESRNNGEPASNAEALQVVGIAVGCDDLSGTSSVGRARASHARGHGFESRVPLQIACRMPTIRQAAR